MQNMHYINKQTTTSGDAAIPVSEDDRAALTPILKRDELGVVLCLFGTRHTARPLRRRSTPLKPLSPWRSFQARERITCTRDDHRSDLFITASSSFNGSIRFVHNPEWVQSIQFCLI